MSLLSLLAPAEAAHSMIRACFFEFLPSPCVLARLKQGLAIAIVGPLFISSIPDFSEEHCLTMKEENRMLVLDHSSSLGQYFQT